LVVSFPHSPMFRPQCFSHSRRFAPSCTSWVCFAPLPRSRFLFRGFPRQSADQTFAWPYPPVVNIAVRCLAFRVLSNCRSVVSVPRGCLSRTLDPLLSFCSFGFFSTHLDHVFALLHS
jgi:hypothetical protein